MKKSFLHLFTLILVFFMWSCTQDSEKASSIRIKGSIINPQGKTVSIISMDPLKEMIKLEEASVDSSGKFQMTIQAEDPMEAYILYAGRNAQIWLEPGFDLKIAFEGSDFENTINFKGKGSIENNFLSQMRFLNEKFSKEPKENIEDFRDFMSSYLSEANQLINNLTKKKQASELFVLIEKNKIKNRFPGSFYQFLKSYRYENSEMFELKENERDIWKNLDLQDNRLLISDNHRQAVLNFISNLTYDYARNDPSGSRVVGRKKAMEDLRSMDVNPDYIEFILVTGISDRLEYPGFKYAKPDYDTFLMEYPDSRFIKPLQNKFSKWFELTKGKPAPNFGGITPEGDKVSLDDFRGNVIYVDIWASWCKPCYEEFPYAKALKNEFSNGEKVIFMYVSIDDKQEAWLRGLQKIPEIEGVHILSENAWQSQIAEDYVINNIPRYMLIDQQGNIVDVEAKQPSSEELASEIRSLLP